LNSALYIRDSIILATNYQMLYV